jgi:hypothetical protein
MYCLALVFGIFSVLTITSESSFFPPIPQPPTPPPEFPTGSTWPSPQLSFTDDTARAYFDASAVAASAYYNRHISYEQYTAGIVFASDFEYVLDCVTYPREVFLNGIRNIPMQTSTVDATRKYIGYHSDADNDAIFYVLDLMLVIYLGPWGSPITTTISTVKIEDWFNKNGQLTRLVSHTIYSPITSSTIYQGMGFAPGTATQSSLATVANYFLGTGDNAVADMMDMDMDMDDVEDGNGNGGVHIISVLATQYPTQVVIMAVIAMWMMPFLAYRLIYSCCRQAQKCYKKNRALEQVQVQGEYELCDTEKDSNTVTDTTTISNE